MADPLRPDPSERTHVVPSSFRSTLEPVLADPDAALLRAAAARELDKSRAAVLVMASWLDAHGRPALRTWLRESPGADAPIAVSVGAHTQVDVGPIHGAALRHVLLLTDPRRRPGLLEVIDLCSHDGFRADGAHGVRHLETLVPQRLGVGSADLVALTLAPGEGVFSAWERAEAPGVLAGEERAPAAAAPAVAPRAGVCQVSVRVATHATEPLSPPRTRELTRMVPVDAVRGTVRLTPGEDALRAGILIGRYDRCAAGDARDETLSRVHAWVRARGDGLLVVDTGSTHGTRLVEGGRAAVLDRGARARVTGARAHLVCGETHVVIERTVR